MEEIDVKLANKLSKQTIHGYFEGVRESLKKIPPESTSKREIRTIKDVLISKMGHFITDHGIEKHLTFSAIAASNSQKHHDLMLIAQAAEKFKKEHKLE